MSVYCACDAHIVESPEVFAGLIPHFDTRAQHGGIHQAGRTPGPSVALSDRRLHVGCCRLAGHHLDDPTPPLPYL